MGQNDLGDFYYQRGDLANALKRYAHSRDYCTTSKHIINLCLNVIRVSLGIAPFHYNSPCLYLQILSEMNNYSHVTNYVSKAEQTPDVNDPTIQPKLKVCSGLANIENKKYKVAAQKFLETNFNLADFTDVCSLIMFDTLKLISGCRLLPLKTLQSMEDCALWPLLIDQSSRRRYFGWYFPTNFCSLFEQVIDNQVFRNFLELVPEIREMINDFYSSRYKSCLSHLEKLKVSCLPQKKKY